jgi:LAO/AO transport system kinase
LVETVGTGQSEYLASYLTDMTIFLVQPGAGDELQGIKRGIMEVADLILVNKSEDNIAAQKTAASYESALSLFPPKFRDFYPKIIKISSLHNQGIDEVSNYISKFFQHIQKSNLLADHRNMQELYWYDSFIKDIIYQNIISNPKIAALYSSYRKDIEDKKSTSYLSSLQFIENIKSLLS